MWLTKKLNYVSLEEARQLIIKAIAQKKLEWEVVSILRAYNRVLAEDIESEVDIPPHSISHFDGYAVRAEDTFQASMSTPILLKVVGHVYPDGEFKGEVNIGEAVYISTGCTLPAGTNAVVPVELAKNKGGFIEIRRSVQPNENVIPKGADVKRGEKVFHAGHVLRAQDIKFLADMKKWTVKVYKKPVVAIAPVGNELTYKIEEADKKKFDSHGVVISIMVKEAGGEPLNIGVTPDDVDAIQRILKMGFEKADIIATIGGASVGEKDYVLEAVKRLGTARVMIRGIKLQPGRVTSLCVLNGKPIVMLPGHIQSTLVGFYSILLPLIRLMSGLQLKAPHLTLKAKISRKIIVKEFLPFERVRFVKLKKAFGDYVAEPIMGNSSLTSVVVKADGFIIIPEGKETIEEGEEVDVHFIKGLFP